jgi:hypothetical protein
LARWRAPVSSSVIHAAVSKPDRNTALASATKAALLAVSSRTTWRLEMAMPRPFSKAVIRSVVTWP